MMARGRARALGVGLVLLVMPMITLSGIRTPWESMPAWLQVAMTLSPLHYFAEATYGILLRGAGLLGLSVWRLRRAGSWS